MEVSGQLHAPDPLPLGKEPLIPIGYKARWAPDRYGGCMRFVDGT